MLCEGKAGGMLCREGVEMVWWQGRSEGVHHTLFTLSWFHHWFNNHTMLSYNTSQAFVTTSCEFPWSTTYLTGLFGTNITATTHIFDDTTWQTKTTIKVRRSKNTTTGGQVYIYSTRRSWRRKRRSTSRKWTISCEQVLYLTQGQSKHCICLETQYPSGKRCL